MDIDFHIFGTKSKGTIVVITIILWKKLLTPKKQWEVICAWNEVSWWNGKGDKLKYMYNTHLIASLLMDSCSKDFLLRIPSLGLNFWKK
jgi:hypothetical protein